jgi:hypothetical protein
MWSGTAMISDFEKNVDLLHDARVFGFLFDNNREIFESYFYLYIQLFGFFDDDFYHMRKALICFKDAKILKFSIENDLSQGQYFIADLEVNSIVSGGYEFRIIFNSNDIELKLHAGCMELITSELEGLGKDQYLGTNWRDFLK